MGGKNPKGYTTQYYRDALAEALRKHVRYADVVHIEYAAKAASAVARVSAWLEDADETE